MSCDEFIKQWYDAHDGCGRELTPDARLHLSACPVCQTETEAVDELEQALRRSLSRQAMQARPHPAAVAAAVSAAVAAAQPAYPPPAPSAPRPSRRDKASRLYLLPPAAQGVARWAVAAMLIVALSVLGQGRPSGVMPAYADATATAAASLPSVTPSATFSTVMLGTPAVISYAPATATPAPP